VIFVALCRKRDRSRTKPLRAQCRRPQQYPREIDAGAVVPPLGDQLASDEDRATRNRAPKHARHQQRIRGIDAARHLQGEPPPRSHAAHARPSSRLSLARGAKLGAKRSDTVGSPARAATELGVGTALGARPDRHRGQAFVAR
jgi:hypothetical protein